MVFIKHTRACRFGHDIYVMKAVIYLSLFNIYLTRWNPVRGRPAHDRQQHKKHRVTNKKHGTRRVQRNYKIRDRDINELI